MKLREPFKISARLMPAVQVGGAWISLAVGRVDRNGRDIYTAWIDLEDGSEHEVTDLKSGCQGGSVQEGMRALLSFLCAAAESHSYHARTGRAGENEELFAPAVVAWAVENVDELTMLSVELEERDGLIEEE
jgi:hypothetical protein